MTKNELTAVVAERTGITKKDAEKILSITFDTITTELAQGQKVQIAGFGVFETKDREARPGRNPLTGENIQIPASRNPVFKAGKALKDAVNK